jgi:hypothetical protein
MQNGTLVTRGHDLQIRNVRTPEGLFSKLAILAVSFAVFVCLLLAPSPISAQVGTADVLGTVTDSTGAVIPNAKVTLTNVGTGIVNDTTSNSKGEYLFTTLPNGSYNLKVEIKGFKSFSAIKFPVSTGDRMRVDAKLEPGEVTETVQVTADTVAALQTDSSSVTSTIDSAAVQDLPMQGRNFYSVIDNLPGVSATGGGGRTGGGITSEYDSRGSSTVIANGQSDMQNDNLVNGFDNNEVGYGNTGVRPTLDGIQEMKVDTAIPQAEFGRAAGAVVNIITKAGTNQFHGSLFENLRNQLTDAHAWGDYTTVNSKRVTNSMPPYHQNIFGGSIGGPIIKNKTFFFFGIERDMVNQALTSGNLQVPTTYEYNQLQNGIGDFSDITGGKATGMDTTGNFVASPFFLKVFKLYPAPNDGSSAAVESARGFGYYSTHPVATQRLWDYEIRIDHHFSPNDTLFARYGNNPVHSLNPPYFPAVDGVSGNGNAPSGGLTEQTTTKNIQIDYVHTVNANLILDVKAGYSRYNSSAIGMNAGKGLAATMGEPNAVAKGELGDDIPFIGGPPGLFPWQSIGGGNEQPYHNVEGAYQYAASATYIRGSHELKFGGAMIRRQAFIDQTHTAAGFIMCGNGSAPYNTVQENCLAGYPNFIQRQTPVYNNLYRDREWSVYAQDNWRVTSKLTLNLGVRYDIFTPWNDAHGYVSNFNIATVGDGKTPDAHNFILGGTGGVSTDYGAIVPRIGFAYSVMPKTVVRGGFGITYIPFGATPAPGVTQVNAGAQNAPYYFNYQNNNIVTTGLGLKDASYWPNPTATNLADINTNAALTGVVGLPKNTKDQTVYQTNLAVQQQIGANSFTLAAVGVFDRNISNQIDLNKPDMPGDGATAVANYLYTNTNTQLGSTSSAAVFNYVTTLQSWVFNGYSNYLALQAIYDRRLTKGLSVDANWTYAHALASLSGATAQGAGNPNNTGLFYAPSNTDLRHRVAVTATYALPFGQSLHGIAAQIIKGWQLNSIFQWQSGSPLTLFSSAGCDYTADTRCPSDNSASRLGYTLQAGQTYYYPKVLGKWWSNSTHSVNYANIIPQAPGTDGNPASVTAYGPTFRMENLSMMKDFPIHDQLKLQFRAESYNLTNSTNWGSPALNIGGWAAGTVSADNPSGLIASSARGFGTVAAAAGNPRQFQFALRLQF